VKCKTGGEGCSLLIVISELETGDLSHGSILEIHTGCILLQLCIFLLLYSCFAVFILLACCVLSESSSLNQVFL